MILAFTLGLALMQGDQHIFVGFDAHDVEGKLTDGTGAYWMHGKPTDEPHLSPQKFGNPPKPAEFYYHTDGYVYENGDQKRISLRFRVFSESPARNAEMGKAVALELLVLWRLDHDRLGIDHKEDVNRRVVDVYLCEGGEPGGERLFESVPSPDGERSVNDIYIYDVAHFDDHMEQAREVAHEYGHAVLTPVGGFDHVDGAEYWANGNLGEKLFLRWGRDAEQFKYDPVRRVRRRDLQDIDFMSTPAVRMDYWVKKNVDPLVLAAAQRSPDSPLLSGKNRAAFDAFQGIVLWCDSIMPPKMFARSLKLIGSIHAKAYVPAAVLAAEEATYSPRIPPYLDGVSVWIPVGAGSVTGGEVRGKKLGWCLVKPQRAKLTVHAKTGPVS